jgi:hypothetical protein
MQRLPPFWNFDLHSGCNASAAKGTYLPVGRLPLLQMHHHRRPLLQMTVTAAMIFTFMVADAMMAGTALSFVKAVIAKTVFSMICWSKA